jgi:hypothetical protein
MTLKAFVYPEAMSSEEEIAHQIERLRSWAVGNYQVHILYQATRFDSILRNYERSDFKGRVKTNVTIFAERAKVLLIKEYAKSQGKWFAC